LNAKKVKRYEDFKLQFENTSEKGFPQ
jgi:hypothetical protein